MKKELFPHSSSDYMIVNSFLSRLIFVEFTPLQSNLNRFEKFKFPLWNKLPNNKNTKSDMRS